MQETGSFNFIQKLSPRPVWFTGDLQELISAEIHESFSEDGAGAIAVDLELPIIVPAGCEASGEGVVVDESSGEGAFEAVDGGGLAEEVEVFDGESEEVLIVEVGEGEGVGWGFGGGRD